MFGPSDGIARRVARALRSLRAPEPEESRTWRRAAAKSLRDIERRLQHLGTEVARLGGRTSRKTTATEATLEKAVSRLRSVARRQEQLTVKVLRTARMDSEREMRRERVLRHLERLARRSGPIVVGPWTGEVGFELLYWTSFVRWSLREFAIDPSRVTILSRGGTAAWYGVPGARYIDAFDVSTPERFRQQTTGAQKQREFRTFDRELIRETWSALGSRTAVLHPGLMYDAYEPYWKHHTSSRWIHEMAEPARIQPPTIPGLTLPDRYVAVRFYFSRCFPDTPGNRQLIESFVSSLSAESDIVLLTPPVRADDHRNFEHRDVSRVHSVDHLMRPENNLAIQTAVIAGASAFVGTYGGFAYLAPLCGVNAWTIYSRRNYFAHHLHIAQEFFDHVRGGSLTVADAGMLPMLRHLAEATAHQSEAVRSS